jgi:cardiolipin synthase C
MADRALIILCLIFFSCTSKRTKSYLQTRENSPGLYTDAATIDSALSFSTEEMKIKTGIYLLENGGQSLTARLWSFAHAKKSIDIQYYSFSKDITGLLACEYILNAAKKGIKVRLLIDDAACRMSNYEMRVFDSHPNIEIRVYNAGLKLGRPDRRMRKIAKNHNRVLRRMHNKSVTIDGEVSIVGGRNIADEYFDYHHKYNFRDRDIVMFGKAAGEVTASFEKFWNDSLTVSFAELSGRKKKISNDPGRFCCLLPKSFPTEIKEKLKNFSKNLKAAEKTGELIWLTDVAFVSDIPGKNENRQKREGGVCTDSLYNLIRQAKTSIDIQSPYFIPTDEGDKLIKETIQRGVKIRLLTNSLASIDLTEAFSGYQKGRKRTLETGLRIFEFKPDAQERFKLMTPEVQSVLKYKPVYGFHCKTIIIDRKIVVIGSYNVDPRSANYNTECISIIRSSQVAQNVLKYTEDEFLPENSWESTLHSDPDHKAPVKKRIKAFLFKIFPRKIL